MLLFHHSTEKIFDDLVHEDTIVSLSSEASVSTCEILSKSAARKEAHSSASLSSHSSSAGVVPAHQSFDDAAKRWDLPTKILSGKGLTHKVVEDIEGQCSCQEWHNRILLQLVVHDWHSTEAFWANTFALHGVSDSNVKAATSATESDGSNTDTTREKSLSHCKETSAWLLNCGLEDAVSINIAVLAEHVDARNSDIVEPQNSIVNTIYTKLDAHITALDTWHQVHVFVSDRHQEGIDTLVLSIDDGLSEDDSHVGMMEAV